MRAFAALLTLFVISLPGGAAAQTAIAPEKSSRSSTARARQLLHLARGLAGRTAARHHRRRSVTARRPSASAARSGAASSPRRIPRLPSRRRVQVGPVTWAAEERGPGQRRARARAGCDGNTAVTSTAVDAVGRGADHRSGVGDIILVAGFEPTARADAEVTARAGRTAMASPCSTRPARPASSTAAASTGTAATPTGRTSWASAARPTSRARSASGRARGAGAGRSPHVLRERESRERGLPREPDEGKIIIQSEGRRCTSAASNCSRRGSSGGRSQKPEEDPRCRVSPSGFWQSPVGPSASCF